MLGQAAALTVDRFPIVRPSDPISSPGLEWAWLQPKRDRYGVWTVRCPTGCGGRVEVWEVDGTRFVLAPKPTCGCSSAEQAWRMSVCTGQPEGVFMPVYIVSDGLIADVARFLDMETIAPVWEGRYRFKSDHTRLQALDIRLREEGADPAVRMLACYALSRRLARGE